MHTLLFQLNFKRVTRKEVRKFESPFRYISLKRNSSPVRYETEI